MIVRVPGSSANLGAGFDALGMAITRYAEVGFGEAPMPDGARMAEPTHPAAVAFRSAGGDGPLWVRSQLPMGRGLGYSGAVRVAGAVAGLLSEGSIAIEPAVRVRAIEIAAALEGHADNVAASALGGVVATAGGHALRVPLALDLGVVVWVPTFTTSTDASRRSLETNISLTDAAFNIGRAALLVAALAAGDVSALRTATQDRLHQEQRLRDAAPTRQAISAGLAAGAVAAWLSGSGPTAAFWCRPGDEAALVAAIAEAVPGGSASIVGIDQLGAQVVT